MPTITITEDQADALARGENVTLAPPAQPIKRYIVVFESGNVYDVETSRPNVPNRGYETFAEGTLIAKGPHSAKLGYRQVGVGGFALSITEVPR